MAIIVDSEMSREDVSKYFLIDKIEYTQFHFNQVKI